MALASDDPIYAAIDRHKAAWAALSDACTALGPWEQAAWKRRPGSEAPLDAAREREEQAGDEVTAAPTERADDPEPRWTPSMKLSWSIAALREPSA